MFIKYMKVIKMEDRYEKGMNVLKKINKNNIENLFEDLEDIAPDLGRFVVEFPYSEIYTRETVDLKTRELCTIAAITALGHSQPELSDHIHAALNVGNSPEEIVEIIMQMSAYAGFPAAINGMMTAKKVFKEKGLLPLKKEK
jgi:4-carboxymuconolactone decarboxylase